MKNCNRQHQKGNRWNSARDSHRLNQAREPGAYRSHETSPETSRRRLVLRHRARQSARNAPRPQGGSRPISRFPVLRQEALPFPCGELLRDGELREGQSREGQSARDSHREGQSPRGTVTARDSHREGQSPRGTVTD